MENYNKSYHEMVFDISCQILDKHFDKSLTTQQEQVHQTLGQETLIGVWRPLRTTGKYHYSVP